VYGCAKQPETTQRTWEFGETNPASLGQPICKCEGLSCDELESKRGKEIRDRKIEVEVIGLMRSMTWSRETRTADS